MTSKTGNSSLLKKPHLRRCSCAPLCGVPPGTPPRSLSRALHLRLFKQTAKGFTLIELMVTVSILAVGTILIQQGLLRSANLINHYANILTADRLADQKFWEMKEILFYSNPEEELSADGGGSLLEGNREFQWRTSAMPISGSPKGELYRLDVNVQWNEGNRPVLWRKERYATAKSQIPAV